MDSQGHFHDLLGTASSLSPSLEIIYRVDSRFVQRNFSFLAVGLVTSFCNENHLL